MGDEVIADDAVIEQGMDQGNRPLEPVIEPEPPEWPEEPDA